MYRLMDTEFKNFDFLKSNYDINLFGGTELNSPMTSPRGSEPINKGGKSMDPTKSQQVVPSSMSNQDHTDSKVTVLPRP